MSDNQQPDAPEEGSVQFMQEILKEKAVASVVMGESGNVVVQYCDSITVYSRDNSADLAAKLLSIIAETQKG
ncbi:TPA: hypothetical protein NKX81_003595 [Vibrio parahaemolyticus]|uniref:hypothetical protein n=1 Tax=Vibrio parahaemolyticus TaxID=670 RepID=UPI00040DDE04|nr:hypothetical protein [Vibrio parahaemolyticus]TOE41164.1 hypothetical protein CGJ45_13080 [Vibrio parahaemolyticus]TOL78642.1 hypothetical protein CGH90_20325 [Vibrio parahaemolyticus]HBC3449605.1 hypothetical protein [Vibrio parahaemolyticus]HCE2791509.1 hypothetical protein [Vibrio parahaemolyticus]HCE2822842.1 hypothetical protein [Vibrio parahaemolyticus]